MSNMTLFSYRSVLYVQNVVCELKQNKTKKQKQKKNPNKIVTEFVSETRPR